MQGFRDDIAQNLSITGTWLIRLPTPCSSACYSHTGLGMLAWHAHLKLPLNLWRGVENALRLLLASRTLCRLCISFQRTGFTEVVLAQRLDRRAVTVRPRPAKQSARWLYHACI
jgi:hypothetical protein